MHLCYHLHLQYPRARLMHESKNGERGTDGRMRPRNGEENGRVQTVRTACQENLDFIPSRETVRSYLCMRTLKPVAGRIRWRGKAL